MSDNITAAIHYTVGFRDDGRPDVDGLDAVLTTLRKHGISPKYFEYEPERDEPTKNALRGLNGGVWTDGPQAPLRDVEVLEEWCVTAYDSESNITTVTTTQAFKGDI